MVEDGRFVMVFVGQALVEHLVLESVRGVGAVLTLPGRLVGMRPANYGLLLGLPNQ